MEDKNMGIWTRVEKTDPRHTKPFQRSGGFRGTAVNTTYLIQRATELFGPMGLGWGFEVLSEELLQGRVLDDRGTRELIHKVHGRLWYKWGGERGEVQHFGQTTFLGINNKGIYTDEEAPKKSATDCLSKCLSLLGFSADVYLGRYDDHKYVAEMAAEFADKQPHEPPLAAKITEAQGDEIAELVMAADVDTSKFFEFFKVSGYLDLPADSFDRAKRMLVKKLAERKQLEAQA